MPIGRNTLYEAINKGEIETYVYQGGYIQTKDSIIGHMKCVNVQGGVKIVPKAWLVEFYCRYGHGIVRKSKEHEEMMRKFIAEM